MTANNEFFKDGLVMYCIETLRVPITTKVVCFSSAEML